MKQHEVVNCIIHDVNETMNILFASLNESTAHQLWWKTKYVLAYEKLQLNGFIKFLVFLWNENIRISMNVNIKKFTLKALFTGKKESVNPIKRETENLTINLVDAGLRPPISLENSDATSEVNCFSSWFVYFENLHCKIGCDLICKHNLFHAHLIPKKR